MFRLFFYRHAKAEQDSLKADFQRNLKKKGQKQAKEVGRILQKLNLIPDIMIVSESYRTLETANITIKNWKIKPIFYKNNHLYQGNKNTYFEEIHKIAMLHKECSNIMLVGHNFTISNCVSVLIQKNIEMEPSTLYVLQNSINVIDENFYQNQWKIKEIIYPNIEKTIQSHFT